MEKTLFAQTGEIRGKKSPGLFTASFQFTPEDEHLNQTRGSLFFLAHVKGDSEDKNLSSARSIFGSFREKFYTTGGSNLKALEETIDFLKEDLSQKGIEADVMAANLWGSVLYVAKLGGGGFLLVRKGQTKKIDVAKVASGVLFDRDYVILTDPLFLENADLGALGALASREDFDDALLAITGSVKEKDGDAFCLRLSIQEPIEVPQPVLMADLDKTSQKDGEDTQGIWSVEEEKKRFRLQAKLVAKFIRDKWPMIKIYLKKILSIGRELVRKASFLILSPWLPKTVGSLDEPTIRKRKQIFQIVVVLVAVLSISIAVGLFNHNRRVSGENFEKTVASIESKLTDAKNLQNINSAQAASLLQEAAEQIDELSVDDPKVAQLQKQLDRLLAKVNKIFSVKLETTADLTTLKGGIDTTELKFAAGTLFVLDNGTGSIYKVKIADKKPSILVSEKKDLQNFAAASDFIYIQTKTGIQKIDSETSIESDAADSSSNWQTLTAADVYRSNFYLLDSKAKQIWKYVPEGAGLSSPQGYLAKEFKDAPTAFSVDGAVWVSSKNKIFKFFGGKKDNFSVKDSPKGFNNIIDIYTAEGLVNLYVLDKERGGVFVIEKGSGKYKGFYKSSKISDADALAVDEAKKTVYILAKNTISAFKLR
ncbi:MAG: hypothetical protein A2Z11_01940 [Candidatus Woykebacteria bacterium RBG_16_43_9]|uniref:PPM-type phosphatase domain-containing protein n=1 Tax=Candidatus Woykebacteria bacterium RBG_16_43_9 TaxID=1802596 RepID=A0A1G1WG57_9BACT|nr:MAG: hypothetical protein A2Z11_01940 [Candidatus Woykebacteria bacterium RBG_16_43_9]